MGICIVRCICEFVVREIKIHPRVIFQALFFFVICRVFFEGIKKRIENFNKCLYEMYSVSNSGISKIFTKYFSRLSPWCFSNPKGKK